LQPIAGDAIFWNSSFDADQEAYLTFQAVDPATSEMTLLATSSRDDSARPFARLGEPPHHSDSA
jgi:hypothetical protein